MEDPGDRAFLASRINKATGKTLLEEQIEHELKVSSGSKGTIGPEDKSSTSLADLSRSPDKKTYNHYRNTIHKKFGVTYRSVWEYECFLVLKDLEDRRVITDLRTQVKYEFVHEGQYLLSFVPDYEFKLTTDEGYDVPRVVCDAKSEITLKAQRFRWQVNCMAAFEKVPIFVFIKNVHDVADYVRQLKRRPRHFFHEGGLHRDP